MRLDPIDTEMGHAIDDGVFPGGVLLIAFQGKVVHHEAYGFTSLTPNPFPATVDTVYDLASLTKPLATTLAILLLVQDNLLALEHPISEYLPQLADTHIGQATLLHFLSHSSGLPACRPYYLAYDVDDLFKAYRLGDKSIRQKIFHQIHCEALEYSVGEKMIYSDLGFIVLSELIERVTKISFAEFCFTKIFSPLEVNNTFFISASGPVWHDPQKSKTYASTEDDVWRGRRISGEVHDENAYALDGVAGHAGLFSTASDVYKITNEYVEAISGAGTILRSDLAHLCTTRQRKVESSTRALGWDTPSAVSSSGKYFSTQSFGHLGFTGTSVWVDPIAELSVVLLTNRVYFGRDNNLIANFRPVLHDLIYETYVMS